MSQVTNIGKINAKVRESIEIDPSLFDREEFLDFVEFEGEGQDTDSLTDVLVIDARYWNDPIRI